MKYTETTFVLRYHDGQTATVTVRAPFGRGSAQRLAIEAGRRDEPDHVRTVEVPDADAGDDRE